MSAVASEEKWADWCESDGGFAMSGTRMKEHTRRPDGEPRWCFICRKQRSFEFVLMVPDGLSYYGPSPRVECVICKTANGDCFPGTYREWEE